MITNRTHSADGSKGEPYALTDLTVRAKRTLKTESSDGPTAAYGRPRPPGTEPDDRLDADLDDHEMETA